MDNDMSGAVVVVGAGLMGRGIAAGFVARGHDTVLLVRDPAAGPQARRQTLALVDDLPAAPQRGALQLEPIDGFTGWQDAGLVIESVVEDLAVKKALFAGLDSRVPDGVPIGSNSSSLPISRIAQGLGSRARMFGMHFFMPAHRVPLVEVVLGTDSDSALARRVCARFAAAGRTPVLVRRDIPGFLANRIQHALMRELLSLIDSGIASPEDIDTAVRHSFGFRYAAIGPVMQKEISGWDTTAAAAREIFPTLCNSAELPDCLERLIAQGHLGMKTGQGFVAWTAESAAATRSAYDRRLTEALRLLE